MALPLPSFALPLSLRALSLSHYCSRSSPVLLPLFRLLLPIDTFATKVVHLLRSLTHTHTHAYTHTIRLELVSICYCYCVPLPLSLPLPSRLVRWPTLRLCRNECNKNCQKISQKSKYKWACEGRQRN